MVIGKRRPGKPLLVLLCVIAVLVLVSVLVVLTRGAPKPLDPSTPAGVVQGYVTAVIGHDAARAGALLTPGAARKCTPNEPFVSDSTRDLRVTLLATTERDDTATVDVTLSTARVSGPFDSPEYTSDDSFELARVSGRWLITSVPWRLETCFPEGTTP